MADKNGLTKREAHEWEELKNQLHDIIILFGGLLFVPTVGLLVSVCYGIRAGLLAGTSKFLEIMKGWSFGN